ncbi:MAG: GMC family oxidoreductase [Alphaproteobacteria bacterium]|nr:MAG: GMC family oxidoreductase [Alphaproteobacteria bacterium]
MILSTDDLSDATSLETEICIIGAGAAGITTARRLLARGCRVCLIESGGRDYDGAQQRLNAGENVGTPYYDLVDSRLRIFGGTTAIWGGRCAPLDPIDYEERPWVAHSGWPIGTNQMADYVRQARQLLGLPVNGPADRGATNGEAFEIAWWEFDNTHDRFQAHNARDVTDHENATVLLFGTVTRLHLDSNGQTVRSAEIRDRRGRSHTITARIFVLAAGGLENPRLLLASNQEKANGIGNDNDLVGRFFMEHPRARGGMIETRQPLALLRLFHRMESGDGTRRLSLIRPSDALQKKAQLLNHGMTLAALKPEGHKINPVIRLYDNLRHELSPSRGNRRLWRSIRSAVIWLKGKLEPYLTWAMVRLGKRQLGLIIRAEQAPNPESRVTLTRDTDALGMPRIQLDWQITDFDKDSARRMVEAFDAFLQRRGLGRVVKAPWLDDPAKKWEFDPLVSMHPIGGYHHMGTTRMAATPDKGVVDPDCRVFGTDNLYVAGSSVFPTGGWANPTLMIAALSLRLGDHIAARLEDDAPSQQDAVPAAEAEIEHGTQQRV